jgi:FkbM family methyltransferase
MMKNHLFELLAKVPGYRQLRDCRDRWNFRAARAGDAGRGAFYGQFIRHGDQVFDVGANMGNRSRVFLDLGARVVAFEPQKLCVDYLGNVLRGEPRFELVRKALGAEEGGAEMQISNAHTISSLSPEWISATRQSGRFSAFTWDRTERVDITTLDHAIAAYGRPAFIKIDVEGYEYDVLSGLSAPIDHLSIEFTFEFLANTYRCIDHIKSIAADARFQYSIGESMEFVLDDWVSAGCMREIMAGFHQNEAGDIYIRCC